MKQLRVARALLAGRFDETEILLADYETYCARQGIDLASAGSIGTACSTSAATSPISRTISS